MKVVHLMTAHGLSLHHLQVYTYILACMFSTSIIINWKLRQHCIYVLGVCRSNAGLCMVSISQVYSMYQTLAMVWIGFIAFPELSINLSQYIVVFLSLHSC